MSELPSVLVVDDSRSARTTIAAQLAGHPVELSFAEGTQTARRWLADHVPDVILLDVMMPDGNGIELCAELRKDPRLAHVPIVMVTALDAREDVIQALEAGATEFLTKPVFAPELRARVRNLLDAKRYHDLVTHQREAAVAELDRIRGHLLHMDRLATLGTFAAGVGHELSNISSVLMSCSMLLLSDYDADGTVDREDLEMLSKAAERTAEHVKSIMGLASPQQQVNTESVDLAEIIESVVTMLKISGRTKQVEVRVDLPRDRISLEWNKIQVEQILLNLCINAVDAIVDGGGEGHLDIAVGRASDTVTITVRDDGPGIPADMVERVFDPFFTTKASGEGTGLGLPVIKRIVESRGGTISLDTEPGRGTHAVVRVPVQMSQ